MSEEHKYWKTKLEDHIFWILLNRPDKKNAFSDKVGEELYEILENDVEGNLDEVRVVVYGTTQDEMMCSGADLTWFNTLREASARQASINSQLVFEKFENLPVPVIAAVKGLNLTAGFELMLCADIIIAADNARFGQIETKYGLTPCGGGTQRLTRHVGPLKAKELIYTARIFGTEEAKEIGLVNHVVPLDELDDKVKEIANEMIDNSGRAIKLAKRLIQMGTYVSQQGFQAEGDAFADDFASKEPFKIFMEFFKKTREKKRKAKKEKKE
jgi:enoyl-CoA hydratase/carnithine racemase